MEDSAESQRVAFFKILHNKLFSAVSRGRSPEASHRTKLEEVDFSLDFFSPADKECQLKLYFLSHTLRPLVSEIKIGSKVIEDYFSLPFD